MDLKDLPALEQKLKDAGYWRGKGTKKGSPRGVSG